jgi:hypothetical protein
MPGNDEHDPLDSWLHQQVEPLSPPPGTFELITRRARRRKLRKLAVTVASAAAVGAVVAVATPPLLSLNIGPSHSSGQPIANGASPSNKSSGTQGTNGSASAAPTAPAPRPTPVTEPSGPVPANFQPSSVTFVSPDIGWVIGQAGTPGKCANKSDPYICTSIARTDDAGKTWHGGPAPSTTGPDGPKGVSGIRFLNGVDGWAFGPELWATHDMGRTWQQVNTGGQRVTDLETVHGRAYALFASCSGTSGAGFAADCTSYTLKTTDASTDDWVPVGGLPTDLTAAGNPTSALIALTGTTGYLLAPDGTLYSGPIGGAWQKAGAAPCQPGAAQPDGQPTHGLLALADSTTLDMACDTSGGIQIYTSADSGAKWDAQPAASWTGMKPVANATSLAAAPDGTLVVASASGLAVLPAGASQWRQASVQNAPNGGFSYVGMTTDTQGVAVPADETLHEIWMTFDGGRTWKPATSITPGN